MGRTDNALEIRRIRRLLRETVKLAQNASLTGSLDKGSRIAIRQYNHIREHLQETSAIPEELFQELDEDDTTFDELGIACGMLDGYLEDEEASVDADSKGNKKVQVNMVGLKDLEELKEIGKIIRDSLPDFLRGKGDSGHRGQIEIELRRAAEHATAVHEHSHFVDSEAQSPSSNSSSSERRSAQMSDLTRKIREIGDKMRQPDLAPGQRDELMDLLDHHMTDLQNLAEFPSNAS